MTLQSITTYTYTSKLNTRIFSSKFMICRLLGSRVVYPHYEGVARTHITKVCRAHTLRRCGAQTHYESVARTHIKKVWRAHTLRRCGTHTLRRCGTYIIHLYHLTILKLRIIYNYTATPSHSFQLNTYLNFPNSFLHTCHSPTSSLTLSLTFSLPISCSLHFPSHSFTPHLRNLFYSHLSCSYFS